MSETSKGDRPPESLARIRAHIPREFFQPRAWRALLYTLVGVGFYCASLAVLFLTRAHDLYWAYPPAWFIAGMAVTSLFVLGHDCGHNTFVRNRPLMVVLGHLFFLPSMYPFYAWRYSHNAHHQNTNRLKRSEDIYFDNAWIPLTTEEYRDEQPLLAGLYRLARSMPPLASWMHLVFYHFNPTLYRKAHRGRVIVSYLVLAAVLSSVFGWFVFQGDWFAPLHYVILPALFFQVWMSLYTFLHHTAEDIAFYDDREWTPYRGQVLSTVNCRFPRWLSFLHFNIDIHLPHHVSAAIPSYHLRGADAALQASEYAGDIKEVRFSFAYLFQQIKQCRLWHRRTNRYKTFAQAEQ